MPPYCKAINQQIDSLDEEQEHPDERQRIAKQQMLAAAKRYD